MTMRLYQISYMTLGLTMIMGCGQISSMTMRLYQICSMKEEGTNKNTEM